jgi:hypothetical protein
MAKTQVGQICHENNHKMLIVNVTKKICLHEISNWKKGE